MTTCTVPRRLWSRLWWRSLKLPRTRTLNSMYRLSRCDETTASFISHVLVSVLSKCGTVCRQALLVLTLSPPIPLTLYTLPYWSNPPFLIFDIRALWRSWLSARVPKCQKIKNGGLDQYGAEPFEQQQFGTVGVEGFKSLLSFRNSLKMSILVYILNTSRCFFYYRRIQFYSNI